MNINAMHVTFRGFGQQMGMQTVRAILSEDIDICLNAAINDIVRMSLIQSTQQQNYVDKVIRQNTVIVPVNALRTLYKSQKIDYPEVKGTTKPNEDGTSKKPFTFSIDTENIMLLTGIKIEYGDTGGYVANSIQDCRIIEAEDLGQTIRDFCNRPAPDAPICTVFNGNDINDLDVKVYNGVEKGYNGKLTSVIPIGFQYVYIKNPAIVSYNDNIDCDLPIYMHNEVVERAVQKYLASIGATSGNNRQQQQNNQ